MQKVRIYTTRSCPYCVSAKGLFQKLGVPFEEIGLDTNTELREKLSQENGGWRTVPMIFVGDTFVGGFTDVNDLHKAGKLMPMLNAG